MTNQITYSPAYTIVPTYECFNRCDYCNFRKDIGSNFKLSTSKAKNILTLLPDREISEILILSGEVAPNSPLREEWFSRILKICELALSMGFLPHSNVGILKCSEMEKLKSLNVSLGLMLEQITPRLLETVHKNAPSKVPELRIQQLELAGKLKIPFTTGLLLGIGETQAERKESLNAIAEIQKRWGHIQEVILQPHSQGSQQTYNNPHFSLSELPEIIDLARQILPDTVTIQVPPNLIKEPDLLLKCLDAGARDLGGISPIDEVNPDYIHPTYESLVRILEPAGWELVPRLPVYPQYYSWLCPSMQEKIKTKEKVLRVIGKCDRVLKWGRSTVYMETRVKMFTISQEQKQYLTYVLTDKQGNSQIEVVPERGGIISRWKVNNQDILYLDEERFANPELSIRGGVPILFPICGNLPNNTYHYGDRKYQLKQHGVARDLPWQVTDTNTDNLASITLTLESNEDTMSVYPFAFKLTFTYQLQGNSLKILQKYTNFSDARMPFSAGLHPYFLVKDKAQLSFDIPASSYFDHITGNIKSFSGEFDFKLDEIDSAFTSINKHHTSISDSQRHSKLMIHYSDFYSTLVFWTIKGKDYVCLEPWSAPRNAINTKEQLNYIEPDSSYDSVVEMIWEKN